MEIFFKLTQAAVDHAARLTAHALGLLLGLLDKAIALALAGAEDARLEVRELFIEVSEALLIFCMALLSGLMELLRLFKLVGDRGAALLHGGRDLFAREPPDNAEEEDGVDDGSPELSIREEVVQREGFAIIGVSERGHYKGGERCVKEKGGAFHQATFLPRRREAISLAIRGVVFSSSARMRAASASSSFSAAASSASVASRAALRISASRASPVLRRFSRSAVASTRMASSFSSNSESRPSAWLTSLAASSLAPSIASSRALMSAIIGRKIRK